MVEKNKKAKCIKCCDSKKHKVKIQKPIEKTSNDSNNEITDENNKFYCDYCTFFADDKNKVIKHIEKSHGVQQYCSWCKIRVQDPESHENSKVHYHNVINHIIKKVPMYRIYYNSFIKKQENKNLYDKREFRTLERKFLEELHMSI